MNNKYNLLYVVCLSFVSYSMDQKKIEPWKNIDCRAIEASLDADYRAYLKNRLHEYKKIDFIPSDMDEIISMQCSFTGISSDISIPSMILDDYNNTFTHIAIRKIDLPILQWLIKTGQSLAYNENRDHLAPIDLCIHQLSPMVLNTEANRKTAHEMLDILTEKYDKGRFTLDYRRQFLQKMVALQLEHKKNNTGFVLKEVLFTRFLREFTQAKQSIFLADIYQEVMDQDKNTFTHIIVQQNLPDELYNTIRKEYITFRKNAEEKTPIDIACDRFRQFTQNPLLIESDKDSFIKSRCCLFMLLNYVQKNQNNNSEVLWNCCDQHL